MWTYQTPDELYHHGIKGQKWGVRRFQNEDGSLTKSGEKRYNREYKKAYKLLEKSDSATRESVKSAYASLKDERHKLNKELLTASTKAYKRESKKSSNGDDSWDKVYDDKSVAKTSASLADNGRKMVSLGKSFINLQATLNGKTLKEFGGKNSSGRTAYEQAGIDYLNNLLKEGSR